MSIFLGGSHRVLHTWDARWRLRGRKIRQKFGACWRRLTRRRRNLDSKKIKKMGRSCLVLQRVLHEIIANLKRKSESAMGNMINHDQPTICWTCPIFRGCFICAMQQRYGDHVCLIKRNDRKWVCSTRAAMWTCTKTMALFKLTRQWEDRKAISMFVVSGNTLATRQFPLLKVWVALSIMLFSRLCWRGLKRKFQRVALKRWVAFGHVWFFSAPFAGSGSDRTNATTSRASRTARYDGRGDLALAKLSW